MWIDLFLFCLPWIWCCPMDHLFRPLCNIIYSVPTLVDDIKTPSSTVKLTSKFSSMIFGGNNLNYLIHVCVCVCVKIRWGENGKMIISFPMYFPKTAPQWWVWLFLLNDGGLCALQWELRRTKLSKKNSAQVEWDRNAQSFLRTVIMIDFWRNTNDMVHKKSSHIL